MIKRVYSWAIKNELYFGENPAKKVDPPKVKNEVTNSLTKKQVNALQEVLDKWVNKKAALVVRFGLYTGFRLDEILGLEWENVDLKGGFVKLIDPKGNPATLPINKNAISILKEARTLLPSPDCVWVFPNKDGERRVSFYRIWSRIRTKAGIQKGFRFHDLRHTFASHLASSGKVDLYTLQKLLNQQDPKMTQRYAHLLDEALRNGANVADDVFG